MASEAPASVESANNLLTSAASLQEKGKRIIRLHVSENAFKGNVFPVTEETLPDILSQLASDGYISLGYGEYSDGDLDFIPNGDIILYAGKL